MEKSLVERFEEIQSKIKNLENEKIRLQEKLKLLESQLDASKKDIDVELDGEALEAKLLQMEKELDSSLEELEKLVDDAEKELADIN